MIQNNNLSVLPWYLSIDEQNHKKSYAFGSIYPLFTPKDRLLPFQIIRTHRGNPITSVILYKKTGELAANITQAMTETGLQIVSFGILGYDVIVYPGNFPLSYVTAPGMYYAELSDGVQTWYSDIFTIVANILPYLKIEWWDIENLVFDAGQIVYKAPAFKNRLYLANELGKPEYVFDEEGENRDGYFFAEKMISEKTYKFTALAPEYLCDVMRFIRMSDYIVITDKYERQYLCDTFLMTPKWETQGDIASVECEFQTATVVKKLASGVVQAIKGDFNKDFNNDYNNL
jgi:hypothetical protein